MSAKGRRLPPPDNVYESVDGPTVYEDDLEDMLAIIRAMGLDAHLIAGGYEFDSVADLREQLGPDVLKLQIVGTRANDGHKRQLVSVSVHRYSVDFNCSSPETAGPGIHYLRDRVRALHQPRPWYRNAKGWWVVSSLSYAAWLVAVMNRVRWHPWLLALGSVLSLAATVAWQPAPPVRVRLRRRHEGGFFKRNREAFAKHAVTAFITLILGLIAGWLIGRRP